jgi:hypothetical protein
MMFVTTAAFAARSALIRNSRTWMPSAQASIEI